MIAILLTALLEFLVPSQAAAALQRTAPQDLTLETARHHLAAAVAAAAATGTDPYVLLAIAAHESHYKIDAVTDEPPLRGRPRWSCGVMTPEPLTDRAECDRVRSSALTGYLAGARHLLAWRKMCRGDRRCALRGYAGAWTVRHRCGEPDEPRSCAAAAWFRRRANRIARSDS